MYVKGDSIYQDIISLHDCHRLTYSLKRVQHMCIEAEHVKCGQAVILVSVLLCWVLWHADRS